MTVITFSKIICSRRDGTSTRSDLDLLADLPPDMGLFGLGRVQADLEAIIGS